jgi:hypothetical protein
LGEKRSTSRGGESAPMTVFWIIVLVVALGAIVWLVARRRRAA